MADPPGGDPRGEGRGWRGAADVPTRVLPGVAGRGRGSGPATAGSQRAPGTSPVVQPPSADSDLGPTDVGGAAKPPAPYHRHPPTHPDGDSDTDVQRWTDAVGDGHPNPGPAQLEQQRTTAGNGRGLRGRTGPDAERGPVHRAVLHGAVIEWPAAARRLPRMVAWPMRHPVVCPHGCGPITATWTRRGQELAEDEHDAVCPRRPRAARLRPVVQPMAVPNAFGLFPCCRFTANGCRYQGRSRPGLDLHEHVCEYRTT